MATSRSMRRILIPQRDGKDILAMIENDYSNDCTQVSTTIYTFFTLGSCSRPSERLSRIFVFSPSSGGTCASIGTFVVNDEAFGMLSPFLYLHAWTSFVAQNVILLVPSAQMHPLTLRN